MSQAELLWRPTDDQVHSTRMHQFMQAASEKFGFAQTWPAMHRWSVEHRDQFWGEMWTLAGIETSAPARAVCAGEGMLGTMWFPGLTFNFAAHLLRFNDDHVAIQAEDERGRTRSITYRALRAEVARLASAMRAAGVGRGDRVGGFLPNIPEAVMAMLATASIGAIWSSCSPDFGIDGVFDRFGQIEPKMLFAADGYTYNGKEIDSRERIRGIVEKISSIERVVVIPFLVDSPNVSEIKNASLWSAFVGTDATARTEPPVSEDIAFEAQPFDHPLYIMYSSGTTGVPKCIVHGAGGTLLQHMKELMLHCDLRRDDRIMYFTTCGWMMWNWLVSSLGVGATMVLYEGSPAHPDMHHLWGLAQRVGMTVFGTSPKYISACENADIVPGESHDLSNLRAVLSTGAPLTVENFRWVYKNVKKNLMLGSICGGTDIISCFMLGNPMLPVHAGEIQSIGLGMDVRAFDENGEPVIGDKGELVCCAPFPSQPTGFWNDADGSKYCSAYFDRYPDVWHHGDFVEITQRGGVIVHGRSDATLNPGGVRIGTAEIYRQVESMDEIVDSVVIGKRTPDADVEICLFVVLRDGVTLDDELVTRIKKQIVQGATRRHVPRHIRQVVAIPYTISGKKVEIAVTRMVHGEDVPNRDALANPDAARAICGNSVIVVAEAIGNPMKRGFHRPIVHIVLLSLSVAGSGCHTPSGPPIRVTTGHVMILPGIGGSNSWIRGFERIINEESHGISAEVWDWTDLEPTWQLGDLIDLDRNLRRADALADALQKWRSGNPGKRLYVAATSGGAGILLFASRKLPANFRMERVVFISPALSPAADLTPLLSRSRNGLFHYRSANDVVILGAGTKLFGTTDRKNVASAGMVGFLSSAEGIDELVWGPQMILQGNFGGHLGAFSGAFIRKFLLPLFEPDPFTAFGSPPHPG